MKKYFYMLMAVMALCFVGCKDKNEPSNEKTSSNTTEENGENGEISGTGVKNEFGEGRLIIGAWTTNYSASSDVYFTFKSDGTCHSWSKYGKSYDGYWSYDPETKTLSTTEGYIGSMKINIMIPQALQGTTTSGKNYSLKHSTFYIDLNPKLIIGKWTNEDNTKEYIFDGTNYILIENGNKQTGTYRITRSNGNKITIGETTYELIDLQGGYFSYEKLNNYDTLEEFYYVSE